MKTNKRTGFNKCGIAKPKDIGENNNCLTFLKIIGYSAPIIILAFLFSCQNQESKSIYITKFIQKPIMVYCDCSKGRPLGDIRVYNNLIQVGQKGSDSIYVRSSQK